MQPKLLLLADFLGSIFSGMLPTDSSPLLFTDIFTGS